MTRFRLPRFGRRASTSAEGMQGARESGPAGARGRRGITVIEVMIAIVLLSFGLLGLAGFSLTVTKQFKSSGLQETAALVVQSRLDSLTSIDCTLLATTSTQTGTATTMGVRESWVIADGNDIKNITDTVTFAGRTRPLVYRSVIPCRD